MYNFQVIQEYYLWYDNEVVVTEIKNYVAVICVTRFDLIFQCDMERFLLKFET